MKLQCYEEGNKDRSATRYEGIRPWAAAKAFATGWRGDDARPVNVVVTPADDEARALPGWLPGEDEPQYLLYKVEATVEWHVREVATFNSYARTA